MSGKRPKETQKKPSAVETVWRFEVPAPLVERLTRLAAAMSGPGLLVDPKEMVGEFLSDGLRGLERYHFEEERPRPKAFPYVNWWHESGQIAVGYQEERKRFWLEVHSESEGDLLRAAHELKEAVKGAVGWVEGFTAAELVRCVKILGEDSKRSTWEEEYDDEDEDVVGELKRTIETLQSENRRLRSALLEYLPPSRDTEN